MSDDDLTLEDVRRQWHDKLKDPLDDAEERYFGDEDAIPMVAVVSLLLNKCDPDVEGEDIDFAKRYVERLYRKVEDDEAGQGDFEDARIAVDSVPAPKSWKKEAGIED